MKDTYLGLRTLLEPALNVGPLTYLGVTVNLTTGSRGLLQLYRSWAEGAVIYGEFRLAIALIAPDLDSAVNLLDNTLTGLRGTFRGPVNQACAVGSGMATLGELIISDFEGLSNNATQSTINAVKIVIGASITVRGLS